MEATKELAIVDFHYLIKYFEKCKKYLLVIPDYYFQLLDEKQRIQNDTELQDKYQEIITYLNGNAIVLSPKKLPCLPQSQLKWNLLKQTRIFVKYIHVARNMYPEIKIVSDSRETKDILKKLDIPVIKK